MTIPFSPPDISELEINNVVEALKSGWITTGPKTKYFEKRIAEYCGTQRAVCMNSATACLEMTLRILGIGKGDEVITSAYTYTASAAVIEHVGAKIVLLDVASDSFHLDYDRLPDLITEKTKAIIPVDIGGVMCDYDRIFAALESKKHLFSPGNNKYLKTFDRPVVIADAAHSLGSYYKGKKSGTVADFSCFSFHAVKNLTTAEGGAVTWLHRDGIDNEELYNDFMLLSLHGQSKDALTKNKPGSWEYDIVTTGYKCNMTDILASFGLAQLERYDKLLKRRREIVEKYDSRLSDLDTSSLKHFGKDYTGNCHLYLMRLNGIDENRRNQIISYLAEQGIGCNVHYKPLPMHTAYKNLGFDIKDFPNSYNQYKNEISLPLHTLLSDEQVEYVCEKIKSTM